MSSGGGRDGASTRDQAESPSRSAKARRRRRVVGLSAAAGALLAFGLSPLATAPTAHADFGFDDLIDLFDPGAVAGATPDAALDSLLGDISTLDPSFMSDMQQLNTWLEGNWMNTPFGEQVDAQINATAQSIGFVPLIGNGANGTPGGTLAEATGGPGGLLFGNGGNGATDAAGDGGTGGNASTRAPGIATPGHGGAGGAPGPGGSPGPNGQNGTAS